MEVMFSSAKLARLLGDVVSKGNTEDALHELIVAALGATGGRNAMIALLNDELGCLEIRHGAGEDWDRSGETLHVDVNTSEGIVSYVAATGSSILSGDVAAEPLYKNIFGTTKSELAVPVRDRHGRMRGVLNVESERRNAFSQDHLETCEGMSSLIAMILEREEASTREEALIEIGASLERALTESQLVEGVIRIASEVLRFQAFSVFLLDPRSQTFVLKGSVSRLKEQVGQIRYEAGEGCTGWVAQTGKPILLNNPQSDPRWRGLHVEFPSEQISSFLAVPVISKSKVLGVIRVLRRVSENEFLENRFTQSDQRLMQAVAQQLAIGLENLRNIERIVRSERMAAWGELSAKSSHMIGNRVFALKGDVNELKHLVSERQINKDALEDLQSSLATNVLRVEEILQDFRDFLTATQLSTEDVPLNDMVKQSVEEVFPKRSEVELKMELDPAIGCIPLDDRRMRRAVSELVENALNYMDRGVLRVCTSGATDDDARRANLPTTGRYAKIEVSDSGPGVASDKKNQIFQPFFSGRVKGMGLGLSIVKGIADAHGGAVYEAGEEGRGANFVILLPVLERSKSETS